MRKKRENGMAKESGMGDFPRKQFESVLLHSLREMMGLLEVEMNDKPSMKPVDLC